MKEICHLFCLGSAYDLEDRERFTAAGMGVLMVTDRIQGAAEPVERLGFVGPIPNLSEQLQALSTANNRPLGVARGPADLTKIEQSIS